MKDEKNLSGIEVPEHRGFKKRHYHYHAFLWTGRFWGWIIPIVLVFPVLSYWMLGQTATISRQTSAWVLGEWAELVIGWSIVYFAVWLLIKKIRKKH